MTPQQHFDAAKKGLDYIHQQLYGNHTFSILDQSSSTSSKEYEEAVNAVRTHLPAAADAKHAEAAKLLGNMYYIGNSTIGFEADNLKDEKYLTIAHRGDDIESSRKLARLMRYGREHNGFKRDLQFAFAIYETISKTPRRAGQTEEEFVDIKVEALYNMADMLLENMEFYCSDPVDTALHICNDICRFKIYPDNYALLGLIHLTGGKTFKPDINNAVKFFKFGMSKGSARAYYEYGKHLCMTATDRRQHAEGYNLVKEAVDRNYIEAVVDWADSIILGQNQAGDKVDAFWLLRGAAAENHPRATYNLSICYAQGIGTGVDMKSAELYLNSAAELGSPDALKLLQTIAEARESERKNSGFFSRLKSGLTAGGKSLAKDAAQQASENFFENLVKSFLE